MAGLREFDLKILLGFAPKEEGCMLHGLYLSRTISFLEEFFFMV